MVAVIGILLIFTLDVSLGAIELLKNHGMETADFKNNWNCNGCRLTSTSTDRYIGGHSAMVTNRHHENYGLKQAVSITSGARYNFTAFIKLLNLAPGHMYEAAELVIACTDGHGHRHYTKFGHEPYVRLGRWTELGGINTIPPGIVQYEQCEGLRSCQVSVHVFGATVNYLVGSTSLKMVPDLVNTDWDTAIDRIRKADITIRLVGPIYDNNTRVEIIQTSHEFAFGSAVGATQIVDPNLKNYQDCFYDNFEWAVLENALKWKQMERHRISQTKSILQGQADYWTAVTALRALQSRGVKVRGHNIIWGVKQHVQGWVQALNTSQLAIEMYKRIHNVVVATKGRVLHWDVNNENLHGDWYEEQLHNPNITMRMFEMARAADPWVKLFLNEYSVVSRSNSAMALRNQAMLFKEAGVPIYGIGIQSHIRHSSLDITTIKGRLDTVAQAGLPIWITELSVSEANATLKAAALDRLLRLYFSHPAVQGVLLWGFWDGRIFDQNIKLFEGSSVTPNVAGRAYQTLFKSTWRTRETHTLHGQRPVTLRGFKGGYSLTIRRLGHVEQTETFTLGSAGKTLKIHMDGQGGPAILVG